jgi:hypothetical protein
MLIALLYSGLKRERIDDGVKRINLKGREK